MRSLSKTIEKTEEIKEIKGWSGVRFTINNLSKSIGKTKKMSMTNPRSDHQIQPQVAINNLSKTIGKTKKNKKPKVSMTNLSKTIEKTKKKKNDFVEIKW